MFTIYALTSLLLPALAAAQYGAPPSGPATTQAAAPAAAPSAPADTPGHMNIDVAFQTTFTFHPANITAPIGTLVTFWFPNTGIDHSVTQSSFANPCTYLAATSSSPAGFDSGLTNTKQFTINITDNSQPIWFHCKQVSHCGLGMVGSINAPTNGSNTFSAFQSAAVAIGSSETPETDTGAVTGGVNGIATASPAAGSTGGTTSSATKIVASGGFTIATIVLASVFA